MDEGTPRRKKKLLLLSKEQQEELIKTLIKYEENFISLKQRGYSDPLKKLFPLSPARRHEIVGNKFSSFHFRMKQQSVWESEQMREVMR